MKNFFTLVLLVATMFLNSVQAKTVHFNKTQKEHLKFACEYGKKHPYKGKSLCYEFAAIIWQESSAGINTKAGPKHKSFGVFQNYVVTVKNRLKQRGVIKSNKEIIDMLQIRYNSAIFAKEELFYWLDKRKGNMADALASYNAGWKLERGRGYSRGVQNKIAYLKKHPYLLK